MNTHPRRLGRRLIGAIAGFLVGAGSYIVNGCETGDFSLSQFGNRVGAATLSGAMIGAGMGLIVDSGGMSLLGPNGVGGVSGALIGAGLGSLAGSGVLSTGDVSWSGFGKGAVIGGVFGFVAGTLGTALTSAYATTALGTAASYSQAFAIGAISFGLGDMAAQTTALAAGWQDRYNPTQTYASMALGGVMNTGARWLTRPRTINRAAPTEPSHASSNADTSGLRPLVRDMPELTWNGTKILGKAQETHTAGHVRQIALQVQRMAHSCEYEYITLNRSWKVTTGLKDAAGNLRPDIIGVRRSGVVDAFEVMSKRDTVPSLIQRLNEGMNTLPVQNRGEVTVIRYPYGG